MANRVITCALLLFFALQPQALDFNDYHLIDLSHAYDENTLYWPTSPTKFEKTELSHGNSPDGYFYSAYSVCTPEHGGTHLDAPMHFAENGVSTEKVPLESLMANAVVIDVSASAARDRDYLLSVEDVLAFEKEHGQIKKGNIVLLRTGWSGFWPDAKLYLGDNTPGDASNLHFPAYGADAARLLVEDRKVTILGVDTASADYGQSKDFLVHRITAEHGVSNLENLTNLHKLPATGAMVIALPMKISGGSGGPARVVALVPRD